MQKGGESAITVVELNGFDESGTIGESLRFIRVGLDIHDELRPFIYNLLHFGSVVMTKRMLRGQHVAPKKDFVREVFNDPAITINHYALAPTTQLELLRRLVVSEFLYIKQRRDELKRAYEEPSVDESRQWVSYIIDCLRKYLFPWQYIESFVKSYGYRVIIEELEQTSKILCDSCITDYKIFSYVDGGFPFVFWAKDFLSSRESGSRLSASNSSIFGITHGDEYYPIVSLAGNIASITNFIPGTIFPHNVKEISQIPERGFFDRYSLEYSKHCVKPRFFPRILFFGHIDPSLQFLVPYILHRRNNRQIYEPFRVARSFRTFYKKFRGNSEHDLIVKGKMRPQIPEDSLMDNECGQYGLDVTDAESFFAPFKELLDEIYGEAERSNLNRTVLRKIHTRIETARASVSRSL